MILALLFSECPSTKIFIPCSHIAPATKLSDVTTLYPRVIVIGNILSSSSWIYFWSSRGLNRSGAVCCVETMPRLLTHSRWHGLASDPRGRRDSHQMQTINNASETQQVQTYNGHISPVLLEQILNSKTRYFETYWVSRVLYNMAWTGGWWPGAPEAVKVTDSCLAPGSPVTPSHLTLSSSDVTDIAPNTVTPRPIISEYYYGIIQHHNLS